MEDELAFLSLLGHIPFMTFLLFGEFPYSIPDPFFKELGCSPELLPMIAAINWVPRVLLDNLKY